MISKKVDENNIDVNIPEASGVFGIGPLNRDENKN